MSGVWDVEIKKKEAGFNPSLMRNSPGIGRCIIGGPYGSHHRLVSDTDNFNHCFAVFAVGEIIPYKGGRMYWEKRNVTVGRKEKWNYADWFCSLLGQ